MLWLLRKNGESIMIGDNIKITLYQSGDVMNVGIEAPINVKILRSEIVNKDRKNNEGNK